MPLEENGKIQKDRKVRYMETSQSVAIVFLFATVIQFCVDRVKELLGEKVMHYVKPPVWALLFGVIFAFMFKLDVFAMFGYTTSYTIAAYILSGFILSAGAAPIHDFINMVRTHTTKLQGE